MKLVITSVLALLTSPAFACSCLSPADRDEWIVEEFDGARFVLAAEAVEVKVVKAPEGRAKGLDQEDVRWAVRRVWKGSAVVAGEIETHTVVACCVCGQSVNNGEVHVLYLRTPTVSTCSPGGPILDTQRDMPLLDKLSKQPPARHGI